MTKISPRSRQDFSEISAAKNSPGISPRSRRDFAEILAEIGQISVKLLYGYVSKLYDVVLKLSGKGVTRINSNKIWATMLPAFESLSSSRNKMLG